MSTWTQDSLDLFNDQFAEWGALLKFDGVSIRCIVSPLARSFEMQGSNYVFESDTDINMLRSDAIMAGLYDKLAPSQQPVKRPVVEIDGIKHELFRTVFDDKQDASFTVAAKALK